MRPHSRNPASPGGAINKRKNRELALAQVLRCTEAVCGWGPSACLEGRVSGQSRSLRFAAGVSRKCPPEGEAEELALGHEN